MITVVVPTYREADGIGGTLRELRRRDPDGLVRQVVVADAGEDGTAEKAQALGAEVVRCTGRGRGLQMNQGAARALQPVLYFLHADTCPPLHYSRYLAEAVESGASCGCFRLGFDQESRFLSFLAWCTRLKVDLFRYGDQSLFVRRDLFRRVGGFRADLKLLEDYEIVKRLRRAAGFRLLPHSVCTSARAYRENGELRTQASFVLLFAMYALGFSQNRLVGTYRRLLRSERV